MSVAATHDVATAAMSANADPVQPGPLLPFVRRGAPVDRFRPASQVGMMQGVPELTIDTLDGRVAVPDSWLAFVARELRESDRYVVVKDGRRHSYAQVFNNEGTLLLEYRDGSPQRHFQVEGVGIGEVAEALSQWSRGERGFVDGHEWTRLTEWDPPEDDQSTPT